MSLLSMSPRVGVLIPSTDSTVEIELPALLAGRASCHFSRMRLPSVTRDSLAAMEGEAVRAAELLVDVKVQVVLFACTSGTFIFGPTYERQMAARIAAAAGAPVVTTASAMANALASHGRRVRLRTPYDAELTRAEVSYLEALGFTVTSAKGLGITVDNDISAVDEEAHLALTAGTDEAEVVMLSCTNVRSLHLLATLRRATGLPVVTSNTAAAQMVLDVLAGGASPTAAWPRSEDCGAPPEGSALA